LRINQSSLELVFCKLRQLSPNQSIGANYEYGQRLARLRLTIGAFESSDSRCYDVEDIEEDATCHVRLVNTVPIRRRKLNFSVDPGKEMNDALEKYVEDSYSPEAFLTSDGSSFSCFDKHFRSVCREQPWIHDEIHTDAACLGACFASGLHYWRFREEPSIFVMDYIHSQQ
jgi:hypothetical protein